MSLNTEVKVPVPEHRAVKRRMGDKMYLYYANIPAATADGSICV